MSLPSAPADRLNACLLLADGTVFWGKGVGHPGIALGELCFNTAMTGYQEVMTDPSYRGQIITFTFPHIGNTGSNDEDLESSIPCAAGLVLREAITPPSNFRSAYHFEDWLKQHKITGISGVDTRALTRHIRTKGAQNAVIFGVRSPESGVQLEEMKQKLAAFPNMEGMELAKQVTTASAYGWSEGRWQMNPGLRAPDSELHHVVSVDYGAKRNILRALVSAGCRVTVMPATSSAEEILAQNPDGIFLSNGPGDPAATGQYAIPVIQKLLQTGKPIFGICLGHQLLALAMGAKTEKMPQGHRGANHPVKELATGRVLITSQNHGFVVSKEGLPEDLEVTHASLFDGTIQGLRSKTRPAFCVQGHPEASPGPHDSLDLFERFKGMMEESDA